MEYLENNIVVESGQYRQLVVIDDTEHLQAHEEHCDIVVKENASLELYRIQNLDNDADLVTNIHIRQQRDSRVHFVVVSFNAGELRNNIVVDIDGEGCETQVYGLYLVDKKQHVENYLKINHNVPHCTSDTRFKGIIDDEVRVSSPVSPTSRGSMVSPTSTGSGLRARVSCSTGDMRSTT